MERDVMVKGWRTVSLPEPLLGEVEKVVREGKYRSLSEFIRAAVREKLKELQPERGAVSDAP